MYTSTAAAAFSTVLQPFSRVHQEKADNAFETDCVCCGQAEWANLTCSCGTFSGVGCQLPDVSMKALLPDVPTAMLRLARSLSGILQLLGLSALFNVKHVHMHPPYLC
jgi:hypothetical protein